MSKRLRRCLFFSCILVHRQPGGPGWVGGPRAQGCPGPSFLLSNLAFFQNVFLICMIKANPLAPLPIPGKKKTWKVSNFLLQKLHTLLLLPSHQPELSQMAILGCQGGRRKQVLAKQPCIKLKPRGDNGYWQTTRSLCHSRERIIYEIAYTIVKGKRQKKIQQTQGGMCYALYQIPYLHYFI